MMQTVFSELGPAIRGVPWLLFLFSDLPVTTSQMKLELLLAKGYSELPPVFMST